MGNCWTASFIDNKSNQRYEHPLDDKKSLFFDPIYKDIRLSKIERKICQNKIFRRLQGIRQLGLVYCKYIGATHTRFDHSIGVMMVADEIYAALCANGYEPRNSYERHFLRLAALLHDIGHVSFAHLAEEAIGEKNGEKFRHIDMSKYILKKYFTHLDNDFFKLENNPYEMDDLISLIGGTSGIKFLDKIISSTFDADKIEYMLRDSRFTGRGYGAELDKRILLKNMVVTENDYDLVIKEEGISALERIAEARYHMYKEAYADVDIRSYETLFKKVLDKWMSLKKQEKPDIDWRRPDCIEQYFFKSDSTLLEDIENQIKLFQSNLQIEFMRKVVRIVRGYEVLPKRFIINVRSINSKNLLKRITDTLDRIKKLEDQPEFEYKLLIDTYFFHPYTKPDETEAVPLIKIRREQSEELHKLISLSPLVNALNGAYDFKIRIILLDETLHDSIIERITSVLEEDGIEYGEVIVYE